MNTATIYKEDFEKLAVWKNLIIELGLPRDTDEIIVKAVSHNSKTQRNKSRKKGS